MRVLVQADMEGISQLIIGREIFPCYEEYWRTGRQRMTSDVVAATTGLLDGGVTEVVIWDRHGSGRENVQAEELPDGVRLMGDADISEHFQTLPYGAYDAVFQVGRHTRCGTKDGFLAHTNSINLRVALDGMLLTESHMEAWDAAVPVLGIVGDAALGRQLTGILEDTPFLAVKRGPTRWQTTPIYPNEVASSTAIRTFATRCAREWQDRKTPQLPEQFTLAVCMPSETTAEAVGQRGLKRQSASVLSVTCKDWLKDARPAHQVAFRATARLLFSLMEGVDFSSEETALQFEPIKMERLRSWLVSWFETDDSEWCE